MAESHPGFKLISTLRYDPELMKGRLISPPYSGPACSPYYLLEYHRGRLLDAARGFRWTEAISQVHSLAPSAEKFAETLDAQVPDKSQPWRLRIMLDHGGRLTVEASPAPSPFYSHIFFFPPQPSFSSLYIHNKDVIRWKVRLDTQPTQPSLFTKHKTTARDIYNAARTRANLTSAADPIEVLMYNLKGEVMEGSITTVYLKKRVGDEVPRGMVGDDEWVTPPLMCGGNSATTRRYALDTGICSEDIIHVDTLAAGEELWLSNGARGFMPAVLEL
ncbi:putative aminodeoxychorismate lyase [Microsporum audouinii]